VKLSKAKFEEAQEFIKTRARPLDARLFEFLFEGGPADAVLSELATYQNPDGGFGHGIEADFRSPVSSPMATSVGLQYGVAVNAGAGHPIVQYAIRYLLGTYDTAADYWPATSKAVNAAPHAPWWHVEEIKPPDEANWPNPSAELAGYLHRYASLVPCDSLERVRRRARRSLEHSDTFEGLFRYNLLCWQRAAADLPADFRDAVYARIKATFEKYPYTAENYAEVEVIWLAPTPEAVLARHDPDAVNAQLNATITRQAEDGGWWPTWQWGQYEETWPRARQEWAGKLTVETLHTLRSYGKIEGVQPGTGTSSARRASQYNQAVARQA
jgi:hypothetical protein